MDEVLAPRRHGQLVGQRLGQTLLLFVGDPVI